MDDSYFDLNDAPEDGVHEPSMSGSASKAGATKNKLPNFSAYEDNLLCKSWLEISCDAITKTSQRRESFWLCVLNRYNSKCGKYPERTKKSIGSRWEHIKAEVSKFSGYMADVTRSNPSGMSAEKKEKKEKEEEERILAINLDQCLPMQRMYYEALQQAIVEKLMSQRQ
ncbi:unnamed protein product [Urochloa humidicola]